MDGHEVLLGEEAGEVGNGADVPSLTTPRSADELDRDVEVALQPLLDELTHVAARASSCETGTPPSTPSRQRPIAARRSPYGSREPVGRCPSENDTVSVSILSAADSTRPARVEGSGASAASGR